MSQAKANLNPPQAARGDDGPGADWLRWLGLAVLCMLAYAPAIHGGFLWDNNANVAQPELQSLAGLGQIWFEPGPRNNTTRSSTPRSGSSTGSGAMPSWVITC